MRSSIRWRLSVCQTAVLVVAMLAVAISVEQSVRRSYLFHLEGQLSEQACLVRRAFLADLADGARPPEIRRLIRGLAYDTAARITIISPTGEVLADSSFLAERLGNISRRPEVAEVLRGPLPPPRRHSQSLQSDGMYVAVPATRYGELVAVVRVSLTLDELQAQLHGMRMRLLGAILLTTLVAIAVTLTVTRSIMQPVREVTQVAQRMAAGDLQQRVGVTPDDETGQLARAFNSMAARIQEMLGELENQRRTMAQVFVQMTDGLVVTDADGRILLLNPAAEHLLGVVAGECLDRPFGDAVPDADLGGILADVLSCHGERQEELHRDTPEEQVLGVYAAPMAEPACPPAGALLVLHDDTASWQTERMRRDLVANASHELRTPIAAVKMMAESLLDGAQEDPDLRERFLRLTAREADRLTALVSDLLDLSQIEAGQWPLEIEVFALREVAEQVLVKCQVMVANRQQTLTAKCPVELLVQADRRAVVQILTNLLENSIKYTPPGGEITLTSEAWQGCAAITVRDTGIGIPNEDLSRIFERFYRVDKARSRELGGTGLGLAIVRHLVEALGGTIEVQSEVGKGSTFTVTLPSPADPNA